MSIGGVCGVSDNSWEKIHTIYNQGLTNIYYGFPYANFGCAEKVGLTRILPIFRALRDGSGCIFSVVSEFFISFPHLSVEISRKKSYNVLCVRFSWSRFSCPGQPTVIADVKRTTSKIGESK